MRLGLFSQNQIFNIFFNIKYHNIKGYARDVLKLKIF